MAQQTAVEWLLEAIGYKRESDRTTIISVHPDCDVSNLVERAKRMEKEQIMKAVYDSMGTNFDPNMGRAELYYNETYGKSI